ncbi:hypothetical protein OHB26_13835 [Nocardia sp. NBC_01503]|uniref:hypothetical protein n=1 Tax=Nocardia sp. NBC_01503 TaxID=2975997 RepID=UPI002E7C0B70|nr:hypothetical protein [Nocardia sp. NBC_01503]WTL35177.1 hypothetical protein OHB26_13835 [Nocardia sp. NBC_01503]
MSTHNRQPEGTGPPRPAIHPVFALVISVGLAVGTGLLADWPAAVTVFVTTLGVFGANERRRSSGTEEE